MLPCAVDWAFCSNICHQLRLVHCLEPIQRNVPQQTTVGCWMDLICSSFYTPTPAKKSRPLAPEKHRETFTKSYKNPVNDLIHPANAHALSRMRGTESKINPDTPNIPKSRKTNISKNQRESDFLCEDLTLRLQPLSTHQCAGHHEQYERPVSRSWEAAGLFSPCYMDRKCTSIADSTKNP